MSDAHHAQSVFVLRLRADAGVDPVRPLRRALKVLARRFGLRCVAAVEVEGKTP